MLNKMKKILQLFDVAIAIVVGSVVEMLGNYILQICPNGTVTLSLSLSVSLSLCLSLSLSVSLSLSLSLSLSVPT